MKDYNVEFKIGDIVIPIDGYVFWDEDRVNREGRQTDQTKEKKYRVDAVTVDRQHLCLTKVDTKNANTFLSHKRNWLHYEEPLDKSN